MKSETAAARYVGFCEGLTPQGLDRLGEFCAPEIEFRDPFNQVGGLAAYRRVLEKMFRDVGQPDFVVTGTALHANGCYLRWRFSFQRRGHPFSIDGMSEIHFNSAGLVDQHFDFWDAGRVYETVPLLGGLVGLVKRRLSLD